MGTIKLSNMSVATTANATDGLMILQDGVEKRITLSTLLKNLNSGDTIRLNPNQLAIDTIIASKNDSNALFLSGQTDRIGIGTNSPESKFHINGNLQVGSSSLDGVLIQSTDSISYSATDQINVITKPISYSRSGTIVNCDSGVNGLFSLANGYNGQVKTIILNTISATKTATISLNGAGFNTITMDAVGDSIELKYFSLITKWVVVGNNGATLSTV